MVDVFDSYLLSKAEFSPAELERIKALTVSKTLAKHQFLLRADEVCVAQAFVTRGCLRSYSVNSKGAEHILYFAVENWWISDQESLHSGQPSAYNIDAIEDSTLVLIKKDDLERLRREIPMFDRLVTTTLYRSFLTSQTRIHSAISYSAEERYLEFIKQYPEFVQRIPQHMVAAYLGMTTETLSRVRRKITPTHRPRPTD